MRHELEGTDPRGLRQALLRWYRAHRRAMPWRGVTDPYRIWVSEVMLQQTTVKTVRPYYDAFLACFPTVEALAAADVEDVLARWSGLGYYRRARQLHAGAHHIVAHHSGRFPNTLDAARAIPGVGPYTAAAVLSIAYGVPLPVVDGNVRRVLSRLLLLRGREWQRDAPYYALGAELIERDAPGDWNQAVMELGATLCAPRTPECLKCPLRSACRAHAAGAQDELPEPRARREPVDVIVAAALVEEQGRVLLVRRGEGRLMSGLWEVPQTSLESSRGVRSEFGRRFSAGGSRPPDPRARRSRAPDASSGRLDDLAEELKARHGLAVALGARVLTVKHAITFRRITAEAYRARLIARPAEDDPRFTWVDPRQLDGLPLSSLTRKLLRGAAAPQLALPLDDDRAGTPRRARPARGRG